ncbi:MAG: sulfite exporter TauE/SafE family protein [Pontiellaceae bacterium]|nr:sulfite exporter TauE/SafE family protein [Pontiellaceae bacterium]
MNNPVMLLAFTAASIGFLHTLMGPDHYLPFIAMGKARSWSMPRTMLITFLCGLGHVLSSVVLGLIGVAFGLALGKLEAFEAFRGNLAAQALIIFGFTYCVWGIHRAVRNKPHGYDRPQTQTRNITPWVLFTIFVLGPCEPLIPLIMYPAVQHSFSGVLLVAGIFSLTTIGTMMSVVLLSSWGLGFVQLRPLKRYSHALAGASICASGLAIQFLGL